MRSKQLTVLMYHGLLQEALEVSDWCFVTAAAFREQLHFLKRSGYSFVSLEQGWSALQADRLDGPTAAITFDDGFESVLRLAAPILDEFAAPASIYLVTDLVGTNDSVWFCYLIDAMQHPRTQELQWRGLSYELRSVEQRQLALHDLQQRLKKLPHEKLLLELDSILEKLRYKKKQFAPQHPFRILDASQIRAMAESELFTFGAHTCTHPILSKVDPIVAQREIKKSFAETTALSGSQCRSFAYPNGRKEDYNLEAVEALKSEGCQLALSTEEGLNDKTVNCFELKRLGIGANLSLASFRRLVHPIRQRFKQTLRSQKKKTGLILGTEELAGLGALRSLGASGYKVYAGFSQGNESPAASKSRYSSGSLSYPDPASRALAFQDWLLGLLERGEYDFVMPVTEAAIAACEIVRDSVPPDVVLMMPSREDLKFTLSKFEATQQAAKVGIAIPKTIFLAKGTSANEIPWQQVASLPFPVIAKTDNYWSNDGKYIKGRTLVARNSDDLKAILAEHQSSTNLLLQEQVDGHGTAAFLLRKYGKTLLTFAHQRIHEVPWSGGWSSYRKSLFDPQLIAKAEALLESIGFDGIAMVEFRRSDVDRQDYFLEINGRLWGSIALALHAGADFPAIWADAVLLGSYQENLVPLKNIECSVLFPGEFSYLLSILNKKVSNDNENKRPSFPLALCSVLRNVIDPRVKHDYFWWTDPLPGIWQINRLARFVFAAMIARIRSKFSPKFSTFESPSTELLTYPQKMLFLCEGNICRSPFAEHYMRKKISEMRWPPIQISSSGFIKSEGRQTPQRFHSIFQEFNLDPTPHRSSQVSKEKVETNTLVIAMDASVATKFKRAFPNYPNELLIELDVPDPYLLDPGPARQSYLLLVERLEEFCNSLKRLIGCPSVAE